MQIKKAFIIILELILLLCKIGAKAEKSFILKEYEIMIHYSTQYQIYSRSIIEIEYNPNYLSMLLWDTK